MSFGYQVLGFGSGVSGGAPYDIEYLILGGGGGGGKAVATGGSSGGGGGPPGGGGGRWIGRCCPRSR